MVVCVVVIIIAAVIVVIIIPAVVVFRRRTAAVLVESETDGSLAQPCRAGDRSRQGNADGLSVDAGDVDLIPRLQLVAGAVGVSLRRTVDRDIHADARGLAAGREKERADAVLPRPVILLLRQCYRRALARRAICPADGQALPKRRYRHGYRRRRRWNLLDGHILNEHRFALKAQRHGVRSAVSERRRGCRRHQVRQRLTLLQRNRRRRCRLLFRRQAVVRAARSADGIDTVRPLGEGDIQRLSFIADGLHGHALLVRAIALEYVHLHRVRNRRLVARPRSHLQQTFRRRLILLTHALLEHVLSARRHHHSG